MQSAIFQQLLQINLIPVCLLVFLVIFLKFNDPYEHETTQRFYPVLIMIMLLVIEDNLDYRMTDLGDPGMMHVLIVVIGYNLRILIMLSLTQISLISVRKAMIRDNLLMKRIMLLAPAVICLVVTNLAFFTHLVFWFDENGIKRRGPLSFTPHIVCLYYAVMLFAYSVYIRRHLERTNEAVVISLMTLLALLGTLVESAFKMRGVLIAVISMAVTFYYLCLHIEYFKYDILTGALNRTSFDAALQKITPRTTGTVVLIDLNDLKAINDESGHAAGDAALKCLVDTVEHNLEPGCMLYRIGGDEFAVICKKMDEIEVSHMMKKISEKMEETPYSFATGYAAWKDSDHLEDAIATADAYKYVDKQNTKVSQGT